MATEQRFAGSVDLTVDETTGRTQAELDLTAIAAAAGNRDWIVTAEYRLTVDNTLNGKTIAALVDAAVGGATLPAAMVGYRLWPESTTTVQIRRALTGNASASSPEIAMMGAVHETTKAAADATKLFANAVAAYATLQVLIAR